MRHTHRTSGRICRTTGLLVVLVAAGYPLGSNADYVAGMNCDEVGYAAFATAQWRDEGMSLKEQLDGLRQSLPHGEYQDTQRALRRIIRTIYTQPAMKKATPSEVREAFQKTCEMLK